MKYAPLIDLVIFILNIYIAIAYRGTVYGWLAAAIVCWFVFVIVQSIREI